jgi:hypothetical protein
MKSNLSVQRLEKAFSSIPQVPNRIIRSLLFSNRLRNVFIGRQKRKKRRGLMWYFKERAYEIIPESTV